MPESLDHKIDSLKHRLLEINDLKSAGAVLSWDQATYMPTGGAAARARQRATLARLAHQKSTSIELGRLLDHLQSNAEHLPEDDEALVRVARRDYEKANKVPADFVARASECRSQSYSAWTRARAENDFASMVPHLRRTLEISREYGELFAPFAHIADPLIDDADEGMTVSEIRKLFSELRPAISSLVKAIAKREHVDVSCLDGPYNEKDQLDFSLLVVEKVGYDLQRGRLDNTLHPFCTRFSAGDVRITTRVRENDMSDAFFSTLHEAGHALYEQGISPSFDGTSLGRGASAGVHESQARLWENIIGRSLPFWRHWYPQLQQIFPDALGSVPLENFHRVINRVEPSLIRTDADEVTYNLHVMIRFDLELDMLEGHLDVKDLPNAWRARMAEDLGVEPPTDRDGCLQDVHWYSGLIGGGFQGYTIGNVLSAQLYAEALQAHPQIPSQVEQGDYSDLLDWLKTNLYQHGRKYKPMDLIVRATGEPLHVGPYLDYLRSKYAALYGLADKIC